MVGYFRPEKLQDALDWLSLETGTIAGGCTDLFAGTEHQTLAGPILDITGLRELNGITKSPDGWRIGANTTWSSVISAPLPAAFDGLKAAAAEVGSVQIQNSATVGGNICNASPAADGIPPLLTLNAEVELTSKDGNRRLPLHSFVTGPRQIDLRPNELLSAVHIPAEAGAGRSGFLKLGARKYLVISIAMVAVRLTQNDGRICGAAISVGACSAVATPLPDLEKALVGLALADAGKAVTKDRVQPVLAPIDDIRADSGYRLHAAVEITQRAIVDVARQFRGPPRV